jgi:hypothetical protein
LIDGPIPVAAGKGWLLVIDQRADGNEHPSASETNVYRRAVMVALLNARSYISRYHVGSL